VVSVGLVSFGVVLSYVHIPLWCNGACLGKVNHLVGLGNR